MKIDILTLFPDMFMPVLGRSITGRAIENGILNIGIHDKGVFIRQTQEG